MRALAVLLVLAAARPAAADVIGAEITASSSRGKHVAWRAFDRDPAGTAWCEGKKAGGVGEYLELAGEDLAFERLAIAASRGARLAVRAVDRAGVEHDLEVAASGEVSAGRTIDAVRIRITIVESAARHTCISDVTLAGREVRRVVAATARAAAALIGSIENLDHGLATCEKHHLRQFVEYPLDYKQTTYQDAQGVFDDCVAERAPAALGTIDPSQIFADGRGRVAVGRWRLVYVKRQDVWKLRAIR